MAGVYSELVLVSLAAMLSPTTLSFSVLALVVGDRPLRTGFWFLLGALVATLSVGVLAAFVLGDAAASHTSSTRHAVAVLDIVFGCLILAYVARTRNRPLDPAKVESMIARMSTLATSPAVAVIGAGAVLANPGAFIPIALKTISQTDPSAGQYVANWVFFTIASLLPLIVALALLLVVPGWAERLLVRVRDWLVAHARTVALVILVALAVALLRNGIAALT